MEYQHRDRYKAGAAGVIAADYVAKQPADGNTLLMAHINSHALATSLQPKLGYNVERDFSPIGLVGVTPNLLICNENQPAKTVKDLVALCKQNPGKISFASAGGGSAQHLALEMFKLRAGIDALHVPYKGSGPALTDLIGGQVQYCFETMAQRLYDLEVCSLEQGINSMTMPDCSKAYRHTFVRDCFVHFLP